MQVFEDTFWGNRGETLGNEQLHASKVAMQKFRASKYLHGILALQVNLHAKHLVTLRRLALPACADLQFELLYVLKNSCKTLGPLL